MRKKSVYLRFFAPFSGVAQNGKQFECGHTRNFCRAEGPAKMLVGELPKPAGLLDKVSRSPAGLGSSPTSIFTGLRPVKISECGHTRIACQNALPRNMARKNGGACFSYASSVSLAAFIAWIVASTIFSSFSSREPSMASIRFLHSLPLFLDG